MGFDVARYYSSDWDAGAEPKNCDLLRIVKRLVCNTHPLTQTIAAGVIERDAGLMNLQSRRLPCDQDPGLGVDLKYGARTQW